MKTGVRKYIAALSATALLTGCSSGFLEPVKKEVTDNQGKSTYAMDQLRRGNDLGSYQAQSPIKHVNNSWLPVSKIARQAPDEQYALNRNIVVNRYFEDMEDVAYYLTDLTGLVISLDTESRTAMATTTAESTDSGSDTSEAQTTPSRLLSSRSMPIVYQGDIRGFLDTIAARYNVFWEWSNGGVTLFKTKTKTFRLAALPGDTRMSTNITSSSGGSATSSGSGDSGGGDSGASSSSDMSAGVEFSGMSIWQSVESNIQTMLSPNGSVSVTPATGTITVNDTPIALKKIEQYVRDQNSALSRQVVINVQVLSVDLNTNHEYGINWDSVYQNLNKKVGIELGSNFAADSAATSLTFNVLNGSPWGGSSAVIDALSQQGHVSQVTSASVVTINNQPAPIQVGRQTSYLASSTTTLDSDGGASSISLTPGTVNSGFSMSVLPHILNNKRLMLQYSGDLSSLREITSVSSGDSTIQTPEVDVRNFLQRVIMNSGEILVIAGFEQFDLSGTSHGLGNAENLAFGGGTVKDRTKTVIVVLVQPVLMSGTK